MLQLLSRIKASPDKWQVGFRGAATQWWARALRTHVQVTIEVVLEEGAGQSTTWMWNNCHTGARTPSAAGRMASVCFSFFRNVP